MTEAIIVALISAALVVVEAVGVLISKWAAAKRRVEKRAYEHAAAKAVEQAASGATPAAAAKEVARRFEEAKRAEVRREFESIVWEVSPGPEVLFLTLTLLIALFTTFNHSAPEIRLAISPWLVARGASAVPILFLSTLVSLIVWATSVWLREVLLAEALERKARWHFGLIGSGAAGLGLVLYLLIAGRGIA